jgi:hypothetical protein
MADLEDGVVSNHASSNNRRRRDHAAKGGRCGKAHVACHDQEDVRCALRRHHKFRPIRRRMSRVGVDLASEFLRPRQVSAVHGCRRAGGARSLRWPPSCQSGRRQTIVMQTRSVQAMRSWLAVLGAAAMLIATPSPLWATAFDTETVDSTGNVGQYASLALDAHDNPSIAYYDDTNHYLKFARWDGTSWKKVVVDDESGVGRYASLALDAQANPRIAYHAAFFANEDLKFASWDGTSWKKETVDTEGKVGRGPSLALDAHGNPRIAYRDNTNGALKFASWDGASWKKEVVDEGDVGVSASLALDAHGNPRIAYYDHTNRALRFASWDGTSWKKEIVDTEGEVGVYASLALDAHGNPRIAYHDVTNRDLKFASRDGTSWKKETVDTEGYVGQWASLALDAHGNPRIAYYDATNRDLKLASWDGTSWKKEVVDTEGDAGQYASLALDVQGKPHIAYYAFYDLSHQALKYVSERKCIPYCVRKRNKFWVYCNKIPCIVIYEIKPPGPFPKPRPFEQAVLVGGGQIQGVRVVNHLVKEIFVQPGSAVAFYSDADKAPDIKLSETTRPVGFLGVKDVPLPTKEAPIITGLTLRKSGIGSELVGVVFSPTKLDVR